MIIKGTRIQKLELHLRRLKSGQQIVFGISATERFSDRLTRIGFTEALEYGESILPSPSFGTISRFNARGKIIKHKNQPKEIVYHQKEWHWKQWRGRNSSEVKSKIVDVPYKCYPRTLIAPPSIELRITAGTSGETLITSPVIRFDGTNQAHLLHIVNLFLEIFGECQIFHANLDAIINTPIKNINWTVLPQGTYPWSSLKSQVKELVKYLPEGNQKIIENRLETVNRYKPDCIRIGRAGFKGYIVFG